MDMRSKTIYIIIAVLVVLGAATWLGMAKRDAPEEPQTGVVAPSNREAANNAQPAADIAPPPPGRDKASQITVSDQRAGNQVVVDYAQFSQTSFVAIHENNNGQPGRLIGTSKLLSASPAEDLVINANLVAGRQYLAQLHADNGDDKFDAATDKVVQDKDGKPVTVTFEAITR